MCDWRTESTKRDGSALYSPPRHAGTAPGIPAGMCLSKARWTKKEEGIGHGQDVNKHSADPYYTQHCIPTPLQFSLFLIHHLSLFSYDHDRRASS